MLLRSLGRIDEASREIQRAQELDPLSPIINVNVGMILYWQGHYDQAVAVYRKLVELNPSFAAAHHGLGHAYIGKRRFSDAVNEFQISRTLGENGSCNLGCLGYAYALSGQTEAARKLIAELTRSLQQGQEVQFSLALAYHGLGDREQTFNWLERALAQQDQELLSLRSDQLWDGLRSEPRFLALLKKMGLEK